MSDTSLAEAVNARTELLLPFVAPILVFPRKGTHANGWITGATALLAKSPEAQFLVTADHVSRGIDAEKAKQDVVVLLCGAGREPIDITDWQYIDRDASVDICTIRIPAEFSPSIINKKFYSLQPWPSQRALRGDEALILGFPAGHRAGTENTLNLRVLPIHDFVSDVGPRRFAIADELAGRAIVRNPEGLNFPDCLGGMSGSPVFRITKDKSEFLGVFSDGTDGLQGTYLCGHAEFILANGKLDFGLIPPNV